MKNMNTIINSKLFKRAFCLLLAIVSVFAPLHDCGLAQYFSISAYADSSSTITYYPRCNVKCTSIVDGLKSIGVDSSYSNRKSIAALNGMSNYTGTAAQNTLMLNTLKSGRLIKSKGSSCTASQSGTPLSTNLSKVNFIKQTSKACKASSVAMAINIIEGKNDYTTSKMGNSNCSSIQNKHYTGSNKLGYVGIYKTDSYVGSAASQKQAIEQSLSIGVPIVVAVHSTIKGRTQHHWVVVVGKSGSDYLIVDPAGSGSGKVSNCTTTMSKAHYVFGLADYATLHYGYVTFQRG